MRRARKIFNFILVFSIIFLLIGINLTTATENSENNQNESQVQPITGVEHSVEKYYQIVNSSEEEAEEDEIDNTIIIQERIEVYRNENSPEIENENLVVVLPVLQEQSPDSVVILVNGVKLEESSYSYNIQNGILRITLDEESELQYIGESTDIYQIICRYSGVEFEENTSVNLNTTLYTKCKNIDEVTIQKEDNVEISQVGSSLSLGGQITNQIYKGYLYQGSQRDTDYIEKYQVSVSSLEDIDEITMSLESENYIQETEEEINLYDVNGNTYFTGIYLSKDNMLRILGEDGSVTIKDLNDNVLYTINKDTEADENGNIRIDYENSDLNRIQIIITKPVEEGNLDIYNIKTMNPNTGYTRDELETFSKFAEVIKANDETAVLIMELLDTTPQASLQLSKTEISTMQENQEMEIKVTLNGTDETMELYNNPLLQITFPDEVDAVSLQSDISLLYDQELQIVNSWVDGTTVYIELQGQQTSYKEDAIQGAEIYFKVNLTLNKKATNNEGEIKLNVVNQGNGKTVEVSEQISIVSPRDMITINSISEVGVETYGQEESSEVTLNRNNDKVQVQVSSEIINNTENVQDVKILGEMLTNSSENNLDATLISSLSVEGVSATVYYTENEDADEDLSDSDNGWTTNLESLSNPTKYLITVDSMNVADTLTTTYTVAIPESLEYNQEATESYTVMFSDTESTSNNVKATAVTLTTGEGPTLEGSLTASVGNDTISDGDTVKVGEVIYYNLALTNTGTEAATNVTVSVPVPEGTTILEEKEAVLEGEADADSDEEKGYVYGNGFYNEMEGSTYTTTVESIEAGETVNVQILVRPDSTDSSPITVVPEVTYSEYTVELDGFSVNVEEGKFQVYVKIEEEPSVIHSVGTHISYIIGVKNISDTTQTNIQVNVDKSDCLELMAAGIGEESYTEEPLVIDSLEPGEEKTIKYVCYIGEIEEYEEYLLLTAEIIDSEGETTRANVFSTIAYGLFLDINLSATNESGYIKTDDIIEYVLTITNTGMSDISINIEEEISSELSIISVTQNGNTLEDGETVKISGNTVYVTYGYLNSGETIELIIQTIVNYSDTRTEDIDIITQAIITANTETLTSNEVMHTIEAQELETEDPDVDNPDVENPDDENPDVENPDDDNPDVDDSDNSSEEVNTYTIRGTAWLDENSDGEMQDSEEKIQNISVMVIDVETNELATDLDGNEITATTNSSGVYTLNGLVAGKYMVVFEYDVDRYTLTTYQKSGVSDSRNSDVVSRSLTINGTQGTYAVTDTIEITDGSVGNISIGLIRAQDFDLQIDKYVSRVVVQSSSGTKVYSFNDTSLARVELEASDMNNTSVVIEYSIVITNVGEVDAYAREIVDELPDGFEFSSELNKDWYVIGSEAHNVSIANDVISPNESKTLTLVLTKSMTSNSSGTYTNVASIADSYNESGVQDLNTSNDTSQAQTILGIRTGSVILNITLVVTCIVTIGVGIYFIKKKVLK